jgi:hypothetical protein
VSFFQFRRPGRLRGRNQQVITMQGGFVAQSGYEIRKERVCKTGTKRGDNISDGVGALATQLSVSPIGRIAHLSCGFND